MADKSYQKVVLIDYDGPLAKERKLDERAVQRIREFLDQGFKVAVITGAALQNISEITSALEKYGIADKVSLLCEHGSVEYEYRKGAWKHFLGGDIDHYCRIERRLVAKQLRKAAKLHGFEGVLAENIVTFYFSGRKAKELRIPFEKVEKVVRNEVEKINRKACTKLQIIKTRAGFEVVPAKVNKGTAARAFLSRIRKPYAGFAFGDMFLDRKMAYGSKIKFIPTKTPEEFLEATERLSQKIRERQKRLVALRRKRRLTKIKRKIRRILRKAK